MNKIFYGIIFIMILCSSAYAKSDESHLVNKEGGYGYE